MATLAMLRCVLQILWDMGGAIDLCGSHRQVILTAPTEHVPRNKDKDELRGLSRQQLARKRLLAIRAPPAAGEA